MPYSRPYPGGFVDFPSTTTPINASTLNTMDVGIKTANDQFQTVTTAQRATLTPSVGQAVWDSDLRQLMVYMNASGGNAWQPVGNVIVCTSTTRPSTPFEGQVIRETDTNRELTYSGTAWVQTNQWSTTSGVTGVNNLIVPPTVCVQRTTNLTGYTSDSAITWSSEAWDTDDMFTSGTNITIQTAGLYLVTFIGLATGTATITRVQPSVKIGGTTFAQWENVVTGGGTSSSFGLTTTESFSVGNVITAGVAFVGGSAYVISGAATPSNLNTRLTLTWLGRTS